MRTSHLFAGLVASAVLVSAVAAQNAQPQAPARAPAASNAQTAQPQKHPGWWRASKLVGLNVYNNANEKVGDINEVLLDPSGRIAGVVLGVGGFLGMGEHDVMVKLDQLKFVNEPVRSTTTSEQRPATNAPANTTGTSTANRPARAAAEKWYPDHAMINATKDQLKAMPQFKYSNYN